MLIRRSFLGTTVALMVALNVMTAGWAMMPGEQDPDSNDMHSDPVQAGYAVITPTAGPSTGLVVFETFGELRPSETTQAGVLPSTMTTHAMMFVNTSGRLSRNLGVAIANPGGTVANVTLDLRGEDGISLATKVFQIPAHNQSSRFVTELFADKHSVPQDFTGTLDIFSDVPIATIGLRFRGHNFSTLPVTALSAPTPVPVIDAGIGGAGAIILAQVAAGGGWATEFVIANTSSAEVTVRVDLFTSTGTPLIAVLNGMSQSSFTGIKIPKSGVVTLAQRDSHGDSDF